jgi:hypothetical protein
MLKEPSAVHEEANHADDLTESPEPTTNELLTEATDPPIMYPVVESPPFTCK